MSANTALSPYFLDELTRSLQEQGTGPLQWMILTNGDSDPFDSVILFGFNPGQAEPSLVAKVPRMPQNSPPLEVEYKSLSQLWSLLGPRAGSYLPRPVALLNLQGQPVLVITHISGDSLVRAASRPFWSQQGPALQLAKEAGCVLRELNDLASLPVDPAERLGANFEQRAAGFSDLFSLSREEESALAQVVQQAGAVAGNARRKVLVQGDFWHGNLIRRSSDRRLIFVDWQFAHWSLDVSPDVYLFPLAAALTGAAYGSTAERARGAAQLLDKWRAGFLPAYLSAYGSPSDYVLLPLKEGMLAACVEKAVRPALDFGYSHPDDLMWRLLFSELIEWPQERWSLPGLEGIAE
jgi:hypothetical protein